MNQKLDPWLARIVDGTARSAVLRLGGDLMTNPRERPPFETAICVAADSVEGTALFEQSREDGLTLALQWGSLYPDSAPDLGDLTSAIGDFLLLWGLQIEDADAGTFQAADHYIDWQTAPFPSACHGVFDDMCNEILQRRDSEDVFITHPICPNGGKVIGMIVVHCDRRFSAWVPGDVEERELRNFARLLATSIESERVVRRTRSIERDDVPAPSSSYEGMRPQRVRERRPPRNRQTVRIARNGGPMDRRRFIPRVHT